MADATTVAKRIDAGAVLCLDPRACCVGWRALEGCCSALFPLHDGLFFAYCLSPQPIGDGSDRVGA
ncbi:hypothetical protein SynMINOS11_00972 [Synechococcus sp. Minos11]|nr:hypothetical protein SynMINOS11_00972 [Synechococcus sp. Minos11]